MLLLTLIIVILHTDTVLLFTHGNRRRHHRGYGYKKLQNQVDECLLRQRTDKILIENLQKQLTQLSDHVTHISKFLSEKSYTKSEESKEEMESKQSKNRLESAMQWMIETIPNIQHNVENLQEQTSLQETQRKNQDVSSRLNLLGKNVNALQTSLNDVLLRVETTDAKTSSRSDQMNRNTADISNLQDKVSKEFEQIREHQEDLNHLFSALPDGFFARKNKLTTKQLKNKISNKMKEYQTSRVASLEDRMNDLSSKLDLISNKVENVKKIEDNLVSNSSVFSSTQKLSQELTANLKQIEQYQNKKINRLRHDVDAIENNIEHETQDQTDQKQQLNEEKSDIIQIHYWLRKFSKYLVKIAKDVNEVKKNHVSRNKNHNSMLKWDFDYMSEHENLLEKQLIKPSYYKKILKHYEANYSRNF